MSTLMPMLGTDYHMAIVVNLCPLLRPKMTKAEKLKLGVNRAPSQMGVKSTGYSLKIW